MAINERPDRLTQIFIQKLLDEKYPNAGVYARDVAYGAAALSGADLRGKARDYGAQYARTRLRVINLITKAGIAKVVRGYRGRVYFEYDQ